MHRIVILALAITECYLTCHFLDNNGNKKNTKSYSRYNHVKIPYNKFKILHYKYCSICTCKKNLDKFEMKRIKTKKTKDIFVAALKTRLKTLFEKMS